MSGLSQQRHRSTVDSVRLAEQVRASEIRAVSRLMTLLESGDSRGLAALQRLQDSRKHATVIGVTGYPGVGKSTLIDKLIAAYRLQRKSVGVLAVDATSPLTGGALLGDRIRMQDHSCDAGVFIRSLGSRGHVGGIARATSDLVGVLEAAGFDIILVETVGVGQEEVAVAEVAQTVVAVVSPGLGDEVQAMKAGLFEVAHILVVNKGDHAGAEATVQDLREWMPLVIRTVAIKGEGVPELVEAIAQHQREMDLRGHFVS